MYPTIITPPRPKAYIPDGYSKAHIYGIPGAIRVLGYASDKDDTRGLQESPRGFYRPIRANDFFPYVLLNCDEVFVSRRGKQSVVNERDHLEWVRGWYEDRNGVTRAWGELTERENSRWLLLQHFIVPGELKPHELTSEDEMYVERMWAQEREVAALLAAREASR